MDVRGQAEQARAQQELQRAKDAHRPPPTRAELERLISDAGDLVTILAAAQGTDQAELYSALDPRLRYEPDRRRVIVECRPDCERWQKSCRRPEGDHTPNVVLRGELDLVYGSGARQ